jgi:transcriptional regulator with XRE-family HTH domain
MSEEWSTRVVLPYLQGWRVCCKLTLRGLAEKSGVSVAAIHRLEQRRNRANPLTIGALADAMGLTPWELVHDDPSKPKSPPGNAA